MDGAVIAIESVPPVPLGTEVTVPVWPVVVSTMTVPGLVISPVALKAARMTLPPR